MERADLSAYEHGFIDALCLYACWKDGVEYIGSTGTTLNRAIVDFLHVQGHAIHESEVRHVR